MAREALAALEAAGSDLDAAYVRMFLEHFASLNRSAGILPAGTPASSRQNLSRIPPPPHAQGCPGKML
jgi:hypothetical protein